MFSSLEGEPCDFMHEAQSYFHGKFNESKYVAVHVRNMDGMCEIFNWYRFTHEQCSMSPSYVKGIMDDNGISDQKLPIFLLSDMQDEAKLHALQDELDDVVLPIWDYGASRPSMTADMVVGASSEFFLGLRASTASMNIGLLREAFGKDKSTNYVFMDKTKEGKWTSVQPHNPYAWRGGKEA
jgi:hypothetical protein